MFTEKKSLNEWSFLCGFISFYIKQIALTYLKKCIKNEKILFYPNYIVNQVFKAKNSIIEMLKMVGCEKGPLMYK